ncbi:MAG TPA: condensation domain-containing protein, partial [Pilimelia sp.]|nr:condensation domain-containing protein [Pilimelia sp.]
MTGGTAASWPLPAAQAGIWTGQLLAPGDPMYNAAECVELTGPLDRAAFEVALGATLAEAEALHVRYADGPVGAAGRTPDWGLSFVDLRTAADPAGAALAWLRADLARPVDLRRGPLFGQALLRVADDRHLWCQRIHHIAADGYAFTLLARRVAAHYSALVVGGGPAGDTAFGPLADALAEDARYAGSARAVADREFWLARF